MATRYLQVQHNNNRGMTSGDGRSVWNGQLTHRGKKWDISSCGTGGTCLSPAVSKYGRWIKNGDPNVSYGCGYSETDENLATAFFGEYYAANDVPTERILAIIEFEKGISIAVRANANLLRPSHLFAPLKQGNLPLLQSLTDYYIDHEITNGSLRQAPAKKSLRYDYACHHLTHVFAKMVATFETEYIFCWLGWDGDNILMDGGILDYGSVRQFGLFHRGYRFDDDGILSTSLSAQRIHIRDIIQTFVQITHACKTGFICPIKSFRKHPLVRDFLKLCDQYYIKQLAFKIGIPESLVDPLVGKHSRLLLKFKKVFSYFERVQSVRGPYKLADGLSHDAIFCLRDMLRELPCYLLEHQKNMPPDLFLDIMASQFSQPEDLKLSSYRRIKVKEFQDLYQKIIQASSQLAKKDQGDLLKEVSKRAQWINPYEKITGDAITHITNAVMGARPQLSCEETYHLISEFARAYRLSGSSSSHPLNGRETKFLKRFIRLVQAHSEGI